MSKTSFIATGDSFITRRIPDKNSKSFNELTNLIKSADVSFTNLETTTHNFEGYPAANSGGTWAVSPPYVIDELLEYGFNLFAWGNNHTLDYSHGGLLATQKYLDDLKLVHAGAGKNLSEASTPKYLETPNSRVALIACTATFPEGAEAGHQRKDIIGRPGINPLNFETLYQTPEKYIKNLKEISKKIGINAARELAIEEGYELMDDDKTVVFGNLKFIQGGNFQTKTTPSSIDIDRIIKSIEEAKRQADYVIFSIHFHEMEGKDKSKPAQFAKEASRIAIDYGAHCVIGHGPHILRGIELYKGKPIFYSLGNFIFQNETVSHLPADFYNKYSLGNNHSVADAFDTRTAENTKGLGVDPKVWHSILPFWEMNDGELTKIELYPIELGFEEPRYRRGWPLLSKKTEVLEEIQNLSKPFGTEIKIENGKGIIEL